MSKHQAGNAPLVFLSYSLEDRAVVNSIYGRLQAAGFRPWMDVHDIPAGKRWEVEIRSAIGRAAFVLVFLSASSVTRRGYVQKEIRLAIDMFSELSVETFLIPVRIDECELPAPLSQFQSVDLFSPAGWDRLLRSLGSPESHSAAADVLRESAAAEDRRGRSRRHIFVAMPFSTEMEDIFYYGIQRAIDANDLVPERIDKDNFTGEVLARIRDRISAAVAVIADLTNANPNVYLELGFAWGRGVPTILLIQDIEQLKFDVRGQRCLQYSSIRMLEEKLTAEIAALKANDTI